MAIEAPKRTGPKGIPNHPLEFRREMDRLACEPGVSVARLAMEHGLNANLVFKWRRSLRAGEYDSSGLLPVKVEMPPAEAVLPTQSLIPAGAIELSVGNARVRIEGAPDEGTLTLVLHMLRDMPGVAA